MRSRKRLTSDGGINRYEVVIEKCSAEGAAWGMRAAPATVAALGCVRVHKGGRVIVTVAR